MSKGIAIETILLLLVGIIVVGVIVYLVYTYATGKTLSAYECRAKMVSWCTNCFNAGWPATITLGQENSDCLKNTMSYTLPPGTTCQTAKTNGECEKFGVS